MRRARRIVVRVRANGKQFNARAKSDEQHESCGDDSRRLGGRQNRQRRLMNAADLSNAVGDLLGEYLKGTNVEIVPPEAKPAQNIDFAEAKSK